MGSVAGLGEEENVALRIVATAVFMCKALLYMYIVLVRIGYPLLLFLVLFLLLFLFFSCITYMYAGSRLGLNFIVLITIGANQGLSAFSLSSKICTCMCRSYYGLWDFFLV